MRITKFAQSCILIETSGKRILVDPGVIQYDDSLLNNDWRDIDVILITHKHSDHCNIPAIQAIIKQSDAKLYTSGEVANEYPELSPTKVVKEGEIITLDAIKIEVVKAVHGWQPFLKGGNEIYENIGFIVDDGNKRVYQTSDTISFDNSYKCDVLLVPVCNHGLVMDPFSAALFSKETEASLVIPIHYDNPKFPADLNLIKKEFDKPNLNYKFLNIKDYVEI